MFGITLDQTTFVAATVVLLIAYFFVRDMLRQRRENTYKGFADTLNGHESRIILENHKGEVIERNCHAYQLAEAGISEGERFIMIRKRNGKLKFKRMKGSVARRRVPAKSKEEMVM